MSRTNTNSVIVLDPIADPVKMRNTKCKRTKNIVKKCLELSQLCELEINVTMYDKKRNKLQEICTSSDITLQKIFKFFDRDATANVSSTERKLTYKMRLAHDILAGQIDREQQMLPTFQSQLS